MARDSHTRRREVLQTIGIVGTLGLAGCAGNGGGNGNGNGGGNGNGNGGGNGNGNGGGNGNGNGNGGGNGNGNGGGNEFEANFQCAMGFNPEHTQAQIIEQWNEGLQEKTNGRISVEYVNIGGEEDQIDAVASGSVEAQGTSLGSLAEAFGPEYAFIEAPFVAQSWDHFQAMLDEWVFADGQFNDQMIEEGGQRILDASYRGWRGVTSNMVVDHPDVMQDVPMRLPQFEAWVTAWEEIGAEAVPVAYDELYQALETGVVESSEGPIQQFVDGSLYEVQTHFSQTDHLLQTFQWVINEEFWQQIPAEDQELVVEALSEATDWAREQTLSEADDLLQMVQDEHDITVTMGEDIDREAFAEAASPALEEFFEEDWLPTREEVMDLA